MKCLSVFLMLVTASSSFALNVVSSKKVTLTGKNYEELDKKRDELFKGLASPHNANQIIQVQVEDVENNQQVITILYHAGN